jgi:hypothetical protein
MAEKKIQPKAPEKSEPAAGARDAQTRDQKQAQRHGRSVRHGRQVKHGGR